MEKQQLRAWRWRSFERVLSHICRESKPMNVLEWGPGHSTQVIRDGSPKAKILTLEHNPAFMAKAKVRFGDDKNIELVQRAISTKGGGSNGYSNYPLWLNVKKHGAVVPEYDLIFVDGRARFDCLMAAFQLIKDDGVVILHDAHRKNYLPAVEVFPHTQTYADARTIVMSKSPLKVLESFDNKPLPNKFLSEASTMDELSARFRSGKPFTYLRFGDADLLFINDPKFNKNRRHDPNPAMSADLANSFSVVHPDYLIGCAAKGVFGTNYAKENRLEAITDEYHEGRSFYSAVAFQVLYTKDPEGFFKFVKEVFHTRRVLLVAGESVCKSPFVRKVLSVNAAIEFSDRNAFRMLDEKMPQVEKNVGKFDIIVSALGQATRCMGWRLWDAGHRTQYFDIGSVIDALAERPLRSWIKRCPEMLGKYKKMFV